MAQYSQEEQLNELSQILRGRVEPVKDGGVVDPIAIHAQIIEIAKTVFLLNPGAIFYLAKLVRNSLLLVLTQEIAVIEDMLFAVDALTFRPGGVGEVGPSRLADAQTALLALEFAGTVQGRPELVRFQNIIDKFTGTFRNSIVDSHGNLILPRGEARTVLQKNLVNLKDLHSRLLVLVSSLSDLVNEYNSLNIPTLVSQTALANIRNQLRDLQMAIEQSTQESILHDSRLIVLRSLTAKVVVALLAQFTEVDLTAPKVTSDNTGTHSLPGVGPFLGQAAGIGIPASVTTAPGPWRLDSLTQSTVVFQVDGGTSQTIDLSVIRGPGIHGRNSVPFTDDQLSPVWPGPGASTDPPPPPKADFTPKQNLHIVVDSHTYDFTPTAWGYVDNNPGSFHGSVAGNPVHKRGDLYPTDVIDQPRNNGPNLKEDYYNAVQLQPPVKLGFKHLGCQIFFSLGEVPPGNFAPANQGAGFAGWNVGGDDTLSDPDEWKNVNDRRWDYLMRPRTVFDLENLTTITLSYDSGSTFTVNFSTADPSWVGFYIRVGTSLLSYNRYEIIRVHPGGGAIDLDLRGDPSSNVATSTTLVHLYGQRGDRSQVTFFPDLLADTDDVADSSSGSSQAPSNVPDTARVRIGPAVKTTHLPVGQGTNMASVVAALGNPVNGDYDATNNQYQHASYHCTFQDQNGFTDKITVQGRSRFLPDELRVSGLFFKTQMFLPPMQSTGAHRVDNPGPAQMVTVLESGHDVFGFDIGQKVDPNSDPYLSIEELQALFKATMDTSTTAVEIVETNVLVGGLLDTLANTFEILDPGTDFTSLGVGLGFLIEILNGGNAGRYIIESSSGSNLTLNRRQGMPSTGFIGNEENVSYRVFTQQLKISSVNAGPGSSVQVTTAPSQFQLPSGIVHGIVPAIEAIGPDGAKLDFSSLSPGDNSGNLTVGSVDGTMLNIVGGVPSTLVGLEFAFSGKTEGDLAKMSEDLGMLRGSGKLLGLHNFNKSVDGVDAAISGLVTPGQDFQANENQTRLLLSDLLGVLTLHPPSEGQYRATIPAFPLQVEATVSSYDAPTVQAVDALLNALNEYGMDRALSLLITGRLSEFFSTTATTASFSGALLDATKKVASDIPATSSEQQDVESKVNTSDGFQVVPDANVDFSDTEGERQDTV